jgi:hypothetical protein
MKKRIVEVELETISGYNLDGPIDKAIKVLNSYKNHGVTRISVESIGYDGGVQFVLWQAREETDEEYEARLYTQRKKREQAKKIRQNKKEQELKELDRLKKKYEYR